MKFAVVGAAGMVGSRVVAEAVRRGHDVTAVFRRSVPPVPAGVRVVHGDATERERWASCCPEWTVRSWQRGRSPVRSPP